MLPSLQWGLTYSFTDGELSGRDGLPKLATGTAQDQHWKDMGPEEEERLLQQLRDFKAEKAAEKVTKVSPEYTANDIETTLRRMNIEVSRAGRRALCTSSPCTVRGFGAAKQLPRPLCDQPWQRYRQFLTAEFCNTGYQRGSPAPLLAHTEQLSSQS